MPRDLEFMECEECAVKPGAPDLCISCLNNRNIIELLKQPHWQRVKMFKSEPSNSCRLIYRNGARIWLEHGDDQDALNLANALNEIGYRTSEDKS